MLVDPILAHWTQGGIISSSGERVFFVPLRCLMDLPEKEKYKILFFKFISIKDDFMFSWKIFKMFWMSI